MLRAQPTSRGLLAPLFVAVGVLLVVVASHWKTAVTHDRSSGLADLAVSPAAETQPLGDEGAPAAGGVGAGGYVPLTGLIDPNNGDNGTNPAQTTTGDLFDFANTSIKSRLYVPLVVKMRETAEKMCSHVPPLSNLGPVL